VLSSSAIYPKRRYPLLIRYPRAVNSAICNGGNDILHYNNSGTITSPNYPANYAPREDCRWRINIVTSYRILFKILVLDIEYSNQCRFDWVEIFNTFDNEIPGSNGQLIARLCGNTAPKTIYSSMYHIAYVAFKTDINITGKGFEMAYEADIINVTKMAIQINNKVVPTSQELLILKDFDLRLTFGAPLSIENSKWNWYFKGTSISPIIATQAGINIMHYSNESALLIPAVTLNHAGNYTCVLKTRIQTISYSIELVPQIQQIQIKLIKPSVILTGHNVTLDCITTLTPATSGDSTSPTYVNNFRWFINNTAITSSKSLAYDILVKSSKISTDNQMVGENPRYPWSITMTGNKSRLIINNIPLGRTYVQCQVTSTSRFNKTASFTISNTGSISTTQPSSSSSIPTTTISSIQAENATTATFYCPAELNTNINWSTTAAGETARAPCPSPANGSATRQCLHISGDTFPTWSDVNTVGCQSPIFVSILGKAQNPKLDPTQVESLSNSLLEATNQTSLLGGDLLISGTVLKRINEVLILPVESELKAILLVADDILTLFGIGSNLFDISNTIQWKQIQQKQVGSSSIMQNLEEMADRIDVGSANTISITTDNIVLQVVVTNPNSTNGLELPQLQSNDNFQQALYPWLGNSKIIFPANLTSNINGKISVITYKTLGSIIPSRREDNFRNTNATEIVNSKILSATITPAIQGNFSDAIKLVFVNENITLAQNNTDVTCSFWAFSASGGGWSQTGCQKGQGSNTTHTVCYCNHLTNFAVLLRLSDKPLSEADLLALQIITYVGCGLSILGLLITIIAHIVFWRRISNTKNIINMNLFVNLLIANILIISGLTAVQNKVFCTVMAAVLHYVLLATFMWMLNEGIYMYIMLVKVFDVSSKLVWYFVPAYGIPMIIVATTLGITLSTSGIDGYLNPRACWLASQPPIFLAFVVPMGLIVIINIFVFAIAIKTMLSTQKISKIKQEDRFIKLKTALKGAIVLLPLLGVGWILGSLTIISDSGFIIFVFHCARNYQLRDAFDSASKKSRRETQSKSRRPTNPSQSNKKSDSQPKSSSNYSTSHSPQTKRRAVTFSSILDDEPVQESQLHKSKITNMMQKIKQTNPTSNVQFLSKRQIKEELQESDIEISISRDESDSKMDITNDQLSESLETIDIVKNGTLNEVPVADNKIEGKVLNHQNQLPQNDDSKVEKDKPTVSVIVPKRKSSLKRIKLSSAKVEEKKSVTPAATAKNDPISNKRIEPKGQSQADDNGKQALKSSKPLHSQQLQPPRRVSSLKKKKLNHEEESASEEKQSRTTTTQDYKSDRTNVSPVRPQEKQKSTIPHDHKYNRATSEEKQNSTATAAYKSNKININTTALKEKQNLAAAQDSKSNKANINEARLRTASTSLIGNKATELNSTATQDSKSNKSNINEIRLRAATTSSVDRKTSQEERKTIPLPKDSCYSYDEKKIYVGGLSMNTNESKLTEYFNQFGQVFKIDKVKKRLDKVIGTIQSFTTIEFKSADPLQRILVTKSHTIDYKMIQVLPAIKAMVSIKPSRKIAIIGFAATTSEKEIKRVFSQYGRIKTAEMQWQEHDMGTCYLTFDQESSAAKATEMVYSKLGLSTVLVIPIPDDPQTQQQDNQSSDDEVMV
ncbi:Adhesion G protein-coupled receptor L3, partial [Trichoplax sp. H2]